MTASETVVASPGRAQRGVSSWLIFGTGLGVAVNGDQLDVAVARSRSANPQLKAAVTIRDFRTRPAPEWGAELLQFLASVGEPHLAATITLPREEVIVRTVLLPGVADKEIPAAMELQLETLHPYGDEEVAWSWLRARPDTVLVGIVRRASLDYWETLFAEAGVPVAAVTFSSAAIYAAIRIWSAAPASFLLCFTSSSGRIEVYGESDARAVYSAELAASPERVAAAARAELRLAADSHPLSLDDALPAPFPITVMDYSPLAWATALTASAPFTTTVANFLPKERRATNARRQYAVTAVLGALLAIGLLGAFVIYPAVERRNYLAALNEEVRRLEPSAKQAQSLEQAITATRARVDMLDQIRRRPQADLDVLAELTKLLPAQVWTNSIEIFTDSVVIAGEADQAGPLLKLLDSSPLFQNSEFALSVTRNSQLEQFRIKTMRRNRAGRTTP
jgi:Tfp pilus assembly protein PilN